MRQDRHRTFPGKRKLALARGIVAFAIVFVSALSSAAEQLPIRQFSSEEGLASSAITHIGRDSQGYLWFSTRDGLSRFDGFEFINFRMPGDAHTQTFRCMIEGRDGTLWFASDAGLFRARRDQPPSAAENVFSPNSSERTLDAQKVVQNGFTRIFEDSRGRLWAGVATLYLLENTDSDVLTQNEIVPGPITRRNISDIAEAPDGSVWAAYLDGAMRIRPDGTRIFYLVPNDAKGDETFSIRADTDGNIWMGQTGGLYVFRPLSPDRENALLKESFALVELDRRNEKLNAFGKIPEPKDADSVIRFSLAAPEGTSALPGDSISGALHVDNAGAVWSTIGKSIYVFDKGNYRRLGERDTLSGMPNSMVEDLEGNLWIGTNGGAFQLIRGGLASFDADDGVIEPQIHSLFLDAAGSLLAFHGSWYITKFQNERPLTAKLAVPAQARYVWNSHIALPASDGSIYSLTREGLLRLKDGTAMMVPGLSGKAFYRGYAASDGSLWVSTRGTEEAPTLFRIDKDGTVNDMSEAEGFPERWAAASFVEDRSGSLWIGSYGVNGLLRFRDGRFTFFSSEQGAPRGNVLSLLLDREGRLWAGSTADGLARIEDPASDTPAFVYYRENEGLASRNVRAIIDDDLGNIYVGTVRGIDRLDPVTGRIRHYSTNDGLAADFITAAIRDKQGRLWFGTPNGISRLEPRTEAPGGPRPVFINRVEIAGEPHPISSFGQPEIGQLDLGSSQNNLRIVVSGVGYGLRFQYRLNGAGQSDWSTPAAERVFNFANLAPGTYSLEVRAVTAMGAQSERPAKIGFTIAPPFYRSWWFLGLSAVLIVGAVFALDRYRVRKTRQVQAAYDQLRRSEQERRQAENALQKSREERLAELERVRSRIATDLHDDIGASLTQIAVLSQAAHSGLEQQDPKLRQPLERISAVSVELVNAMSDIVWAINPKRDRLRDLVQRMRRFAADIFTAKGIRFEFDSPDMDTKHMLGANIRREVFAIFKEAVTNIAKHSGAKNVRISLSISNNMLQLEIEDDGKGFDSEALLHLSQPPDTSGGNGIANMNRRGRELGGECRVTSNQGEGTSVTLNVPVPPTEGNGINISNSSSQMAGENVAGNEVR